MASNSPGKDRQGAGSNNLVYIHYTELYTVGRQLSEHVGQPNAT